MSFYEVVERCEYSVLCCNYSNFNVRITVQLSSAKYCRGRQCNGILVTSFRMSPHPMCLPPPEKWVRTVTAWLEVVSSTSPTLSSSITTQLHLHDPSHSFHNTDVGLLSLTYHSPKFRIKSIYLL